MASSTTPEVSAMPEVSKSTSTSNSGTDLPYPKTSNNEGFVRSISDIPQIKEKLDMGIAAQPPANEHEGQKPGLEYTKWQWIMLLAAVYSSQFLYGLDNTIVADIQAFVVQDFGEVGQLGWLGIGFPLGSVATLLSFGKAFGVFDIKWLYVASLVMFTAGSALCGGAPNMNALIVGRVWAGVGGAGMYLGVLNLISINTSMQERPVYMALSGIVWGAGSILGPVIGGAFADSSATWRWAFYINLVLFALFSPIYLFTLRSFSLQPQVSFLHKIKHADWLGVVLNAGVWTTFVVLFTMAGPIWAWDDGRTIAMFIAFGVILIAFVVTQYVAFSTTKIDRLFPGHFLRDKSLVLLYVCQASAATLLYIPIFYIPLFFQVAFGDTGIEAAVRLLPFMCVGLSVSLFQGFMMPQWGYYMPWFLVSGVFGTIGGALFYAAIDSTTPAANIYGYSVLLSLGAGLAQQAAYSVAAAKVEPHHVPDSVGFINTAQIGSIVIALTVGSSVFQNVGFRHMADALDGLDFSAADISGALTGRRSFVFSQVTSDVQERLIEGIVKTINDTYILVIVAGALLTSTAACLKRERLIMDMSGGA